MTATTAPASKLHGADILAGSTANADDVRFGLDILPSDQPSDIARKCGVAELYESASAPEVVYSVLLRLGEARARLTDPLTRWLLEREARSYFELIGWSHRDTAAGIRAGEDSFRVFTENVAGTQRIEARPIGELLADETIDAEPQWLTEGYAARGEVALLAGPPKAGKTTFISHLAGAVAMGVGFLSRPVTQAPVLWVDMEQHPRLTKLLFSGMGLETEPLYVVNTHDLTPLGLAATIQDTGAGLVVIDSLSKFWRVEDENDAVQVTAAIDTLRRIAEDTDCAIIVIHHTRKSGGEDGTDVRGSGALTAAVDVAVSFKRDKDHRRILDAISRHDETPRKLVISFDRDIAPVYQALGTSGEVEHRERRAALLDAVAADPQTAKELAKAAEIPERSAYNVLKALHADGLVQREGTGRRGSAFRFFRNEG